MLRVSAAARFVLISAAAQAAAAYCVGRAAGGPSIHLAAATVPRGSALALCSALPASVATRLALSDRTAVEEIRASAAEELAELTAALQQAVSDADPLSFGGETTRLNRMLAVALARSSEIELAEQSALAVLAAAPDDAEMLFLVGIACEARDELDEARAWPKTKRSARPRSHGQSGRVSPMRLLGRAPA